MIRIQGSSFLIVAPFLLAGCASMSQQEAFQDVQGKVVRLSGQHVAWNQNTADDQKALNAIQKLLENPLSANDAVQIALLNNPDLQSRFEDIGISQADLVQAGLLRNPTFSASWRFPDRPPGFTDAEYSIAADFLGIVLIPLRTKIAKTNLEVVQDQITQEIVHLIAEVKQAFYEYQSQEQLHGRFELVVQADESASELAKAQHDAGGLSDADFANQQAQFANTRLFLAHSDQQRVAARERLNRLLGLWGKEIEWKAIPTLPELPADDGPLDHLESLAIRQRSDLHALRLQTDSLGEALALKTNTRYLPVSIDIGADTEKSPDGQRVTGPTLSLELPIFDQGQGEIAKLTAQYRQAQRQLQARAIEIRSKVREAQKNLKMARDLTEYYKKIVVPLNQQVVNQSLLQYNAMQKNPMDLLLIKQRELEAERDYVEAWSGYWIAYAQLEEAVGGRLKP